MAFIEVEAGRLYYETHGEGPALVFLHGLGGNHLSWWQQVPFFCERYRCVTFAHRGFSPSWEAEGGPGPAAFVDDLAALVDALGLTDVRLVAQSMGGWTALGHALRHPGRVRALVLSGSLGSLAHPDLDRIWSRAGEIQADLFSRGIHPAAGERMLREQPRLHFLYERIAALAESGGLDRKALRARFELLPRITPGDFRALSMPVLVVAGEEDPLLPPEATAIAVPLLARGRLAQVARAGHSTYFERPEEFNRLVGEFLEEVDGRNQYDADGGAAGGG